MAEKITIPFGSLLRDAQSPIFYRSCSEKIAWRTTVPTTGGASHKNLDSAIYGDKGALKLFGNNPFANERKRQYGNPMFVAVWVDDSEWVLLIRGRVGAIIPKNAIVYLEEFSKKRDDVKQSQVIERVISELTDMFNNAESSVLLDEDSKLTTWTGRVATHIPAQERETEETNKGLQAISDPLGEIADALEASGAFTFEGMGDARERTLGDVMRRRGQPAFRAALLLAYEGRCVLSGCDASEALEAAHIYPYKGEYTNHVTNGLLMRADLHALFDLGLLTIDSVTMTAKFTDSLKTSHYRPLHGVKLRLPISDDQCPSAEALDWHRSMHGKG